MKATFPDGTVFEGTTAEFIAVRNHSPAATNGHKPAIKPSSPAGSWNETRARSFWESLDPSHNGGKQKRLLLFLLKNGGRATESEIWKEFQFEKGQELAGVLANITRNARRESEDDNTRVVRWAPDGKGGWYYFIPDDVLVFLKHIQYGSQ